MPSARRALRSRRCHGCGSVPHGILYCEACHAQQGMSCWKRLRRWWSRLINRLTISSDSTARHCRVCGIKCTHVDDLVCNVCFNLSL